MSTDFDPISPATLDADLLSVQLLDLDGTPNLVMDSDKGFDIKVRWQITGTMAPWLAGNWRVKAYVESIGAGFEGQVASAVVALDGRTTPYEVTLHVLPGTIPPPPGDDTVYKPVVLIAHEAFGHKSEMAGFGEGPYFEVRKP